jgi:hypothetical protein
MKLWIKLKNNISKLILILLILFIIKFYIWPVISNIIMWLIYIIIRWKGLYLLTLIIKLFVLWHIYVMLIEVIKDYFFTYKSKIFFSNLLLFLIFILTI